jgi:adenine-specific DNA-methyltransferase
MPTFHQIWHGDSVELCRRFAKKNAVNCVITDPPFGVDNQSNMAKTVAGKEYARKIANDESPEKAVKVFNEVMDSLLPCTMPEADLYIFTAHQVLKEWLEVADSLGRHGFRRSAILVWEKEGPGMGNLDSWGQGMEYILFLKKGNRARTDTRRNGILRVPQLRPADLIHPHEKPTALLELLMKHSTNKGDFIVDPFCGSGSTVRAARQCGRNAVGIEYDEKNYTLALNKLNTAADAII